MNRCVVMALGLLAGTGAALAGADTEPVIVVPGRPGVPIIVQGQDVSGAVIEGEWGLARGHTGLTIIRPWPIYQWRPAGKWVGGYFPHSGHKPAYGRFEVVPADRKTPRPAESFNRIWSSEPPPDPVVNTPYPGPPLMLGPELAPEAGRHGPRPPTQRPPPQPHPQPIY